MCILLLQKKPKNLQNLRISYMQKDCAMRKRGQNKYSPYRICLIQTTVSK